MSEYRLDRTAFKAQTADEAVKRQAEYSRSLHGRKDYVLQIIE